MDLQVNMLLQHGSQIDRVLYISPDRSFLYMIPTNRDIKRLPDKMNYEEVEEGLLNGRYIKANDPYDFLLNPMFKPLNKHGAGIDDKWNLIKEIAEVEPAIYDKTLRGELIRELHEKTGKSRTLIYRYLYYYWTGGKVPNALLSRYFFCGTPLKQDSEKVKNKVGRRNILASICSEYNGIIITDTEKKIMSSSIAEWYKNENKNTLGFVHELMWHTYYVEEVIENGEKKFKPMPSYKVPSIHQLRYHYEHTEQRMEVIKAREGLREFNLNHRAVLGSSTRRAYGPGSIFEIDATVGDIYLVSRADRSKVIGRPVIYLVKDVFSRMIVGFYVGLEGPSWQGAMMALENAMTNKVEFCAEYGIPIKEEQWPCHYAPRFIIGDRGEMESKMADSLVKYLGINVSNEPPFRADWKGIVESTFKPISTTIKRWSPGAVRSDFRKRGGKDYVLDAKLTLYGFTRLMIRFILYQNNAKPVVDYPLSAGMIPESVLPVPIHLWNWGVKKRAGDLRYFSKEIIRLNVLPHKTVKATRTGITFHGIHYKSDKLANEGWFIKGDSRTVEMAYDRRCMNAIYIKTNDGQDFVRCEMQENSDRFMNLSLEEISLIQHNEKIALAIHQDEDINAKYKLNKAIKAIVEEESSQTDQAIAEADISNAEFKANLDKNRAEVRKEVQKHEAFSLGNKSNVSLTEVSNDIEEQEEEENVQGWTLFKKLTERTWEEKQVDQ